jgi:preprotein translocase subunit SecY
MNQEIDWWEFFKDFFTNETVFYFILVAFTVIFFATCFFKMLVGNYKKEIRELKKQRRL